MQKRELEKEMRKRMKKKALQNIILNTVYAAGLISAALVAPNVLVAMNKLNLIPSKRQGEVVKTTTQRLIKNGLLEWKQGKLRLTPRGTLELLQSTHSHSLGSKRHWDKKWRVLIFDIPEHRNSLRQKMRRTLRAVGFKRLQDSVWVYPYDCEDFVVLLKADFKIGKDVLYMIVDSIENDEQLKKSFNLA